jgi:two-component system response regulator HydG
MSTQNTAAAEFGPSIDDGFAKIEPGLIAVSYAMRRLLDQIKVVGRHLRIATIEGESGVGKHTLARLLYDECAARHPTIRQWGFTPFDALTWLLSQSDPRSLSGFIFLDRVDLLAAPAQAFLLRTLKTVDLQQTGPVAVVVSSEAPVRDLARRGEFLAELAHRLTSVRLSIPPLRERKDDIMPLARLYLENISARYRLRPILLTSDAIARLLQHDWPGNLHELSSMLESAVVQCSNGMIRAEDLSIPSAHSPVVPPERKPELLNLDAVIYSHVLRVLDLDRGNKLKTARQLGISRSTLFRLLYKSI